MFDTLQNEATPADRVVLALNAQRTTPVYERGDLDLITPDALDLIERLGGVVVPTSTLFSIWKESLTDTDAARQRIEEVYKHPGGLFE